MCIAMALSVVMACSDDKTHENSSSCTGSDCDAPGRDPGACTGSDCGDPGRNPGACTGSDCENKVPADSGRLLSENIVKKYVLEEGDRQPDKVVTLVDFAWDRYASHASEAHTKLGKRAYHWKQAEEKAVKLGILHDLSKYTTLEFWVYVSDESVGKTLNIQFKSDRAATSQADDYHKSVKLEKAGWVQIHIPFNEFEKDSSPKGWDDVDELVLSSNDKVELYIDKIQIRYEYDQANHAKFKLVDFSAPENKDKTTTEYTKTGKKSRRWAYTEKSLAYKIAISDFSPYQALGFWVYVPEDSVGQSMYVQLKSDNPETGYDDYYGATVTYSKSGWQHKIIPFRFFAGVRSPIGWHKIDTPIHFTSEGWGQTNTQDTVIYIDDVYLYANLDDYSTASLPTVSGAVFSLNGARSIVENQLINNSFDDNKARVYKENGEYWVPLSVFGARYDDKARYDEDIQQLFMTLKGKKYIFNAGQDQVLVDGKAEKLDFKPAVHGHALFAPVHYIEQLMHYEMRYEDEMGMIYLADPASPAVDFGPMKDVVGIMNEMLFMRPNGAEIIDRMLTHLGGDVHPRILLTKERVAQLKQYLETDETFKRYYKHVKSIFGPGTTEFKEPPVQWAEHDVESFERIATLAKRRIVTMSLLYLISEDEAYVDRIWSEVNALISFPDWNADDFLDTSFALNAVGVAYDWLYDKWSDEQRQRMIDAVLKFGLEPGLDYYEGRKVKWGPNNWAGVCDGGMVAAALAMASMPGNTSRTIQRVLENALDDIEPSLIEYAPDGGYIESAIYWTYGTTFVTVLFGALESALGSTQGLYYSPGFAESSWFTSYFESDAGTVGFHDGGNDFTDTSPLVWFAGKNQDSGLIRMREYDVEAKHRSYKFGDMLWFDPALKDGKITKPLDAHFSQVGTVSMRSKWESDPILVTLHGGYNRTPHGDLDIGNFSLYAGNYRYFSELAGDSYSLPSYFEWATRFQYYRKRAEGQNTLIIGDVDYKIPDQNQLATGDVTRFESKSDSAIAVVDMTDAYPQATSAIRGLHFTDNRSTIILQDEVKLSSPEIVRWVAHTEDGIIHVAADGRTATINMDGDKRHLYAEIVSEDKTLKFTTSPAVSFDPNYQSFPQEYDRSMFTRLLVITEKPVSSMDLAIVFKFVDNDKADPAVGSTYQWKSIDSWK